MSQDHEEHAETREDGDVLPVPPPRLPRPGFRGLRMAIEFGSIYHQAHAMGGARRERQGELGRTALCDVRV